MKHIQSFSGHKKVNEEITGLGLLAGLGLTIIAPALYQKAKQFWSKHIISEKYKSTGKTEFVKCELPKEISPTAILTKHEYASGEVIVKLVQYQDDFGNLYWGYDHLWSPESMADFTEYVQSCDVWTAMFKVEDYQMLKSFLQNPNRFRAWPIRDTGQKVEKPKPVEMVFRKDLGNSESGNY